jgi:hypothetical protein
MAATEHTTARHEAFLLRTHKYCPDCGRDRPRSAFYQIRSRYDGLSSYCAEHQLQRDQARREKNREQFRAYHRAYEQKKQAAQQEALPTLEAKPVKKTCTCGDYTHCLICRNAERNRRAKANDNALKLAMDAMSPEVLAICLEVRALNSRKHQPAMTAAMTPAPATGD